jgi:integrase
MSLWKRGNVYWSFVYVDGVRHAKSTGTGNHRQATLIEQRFKDELNLKRHHIVELNPDMRVSELSARFIAEGEPHPWVLDRLTQLLPYWGETPIGRIHKSMASDYRRRRHAAKTVTDTTVNRDLQALRHILFWAVDEGFLATNPLNRLRLVPERGKPRSVVGIEQEHKLLAAAAPHLRELTIASLDSGMRRGELLNQKWQHIDFSRKLLFVTHSKTAGGEGREIPLTERLHSLLLSRRQPEGLVFTFHNRSITTIKTGWKAAIRRAGIRYYRFHDLRHTFNTRLMEAGVIQDVRRALMGHSTGRDINSIYTHVELPIKREAILKLEAWIAAQIQTEPEGGEKSHVPPGKVVNFSPNRNERSEPHDA